jgi:hypothetical protein
MNCSNPGEKLINQYLDKISKILRSSGYEQAEIDAVLVGTEEQIRDQLTDNALTDPAAVEAVIDSMDSPEAYSQFSDLQAEQKHQPIRGEPKLAKLGLVSAIAGPFAAILFGMFATLFGGEGTGVGSLFFLAFEATAIILGGLNFSHSMGKSALFIALFFFLVYFTLPLWIEEEKEVEKNSMSHPNRQSPSSAWVTVVLPSLG